MLSLLMLEEFLCKSSYEKS